MRRDGCARRILTALLTTAALTAGCSGTGSSEPTAPEAPAVNDLAAACSTVLDTRDVPVFEDAQRASIELLQAVIAKDTPTDDVLGAWREQLQAGHDQVTAELETLRDVEETSAWEAVLAPLEEREEIYAERLAMTDRSWPVEKSTDLQTPEEPSPEHADALEQLDLTGRDCESLAGYPGPDPDHADFVTTTSRVCSDIVERRNAADYETTQDVVLELVVQAAEGEQIRGGDETVTALTSLREEWEQTADDLSSVTAAPPDRQAWSDALQLAEDRVAVYTARVEALESADAAKIIDAFSPGNLGVPGWDWAALGLEQRDCRSVQA